MRLNVELAMPSLVVSLWELLGTLAALPVVLQVCSSIPETPVQPAYSRTVVWTKENPTPWNDIKQNENTKLIQVNSKLEKEYVTLFLRTFYLSRTLVHSWSRSRL